MGQEWPHTLAQTQKIINSAYILVNRIGQISATSPELTQMSERLTAPARSPLRRVLNTGGKESPIRGKQSKSPIRRTELINWAKQRSVAQVGPADVEADLIREQANDVEIEHDLAHLTPAIQRFWQVLLLTG